MRKLTKTLTAVSLLAPAGAYPLGIGELELHSALNQNLNAEISLLLSAGENLSNIQVNLASPEKFEEAGVPRNFFLSKIKFKPRVKPDGSVVIELSSHEVLSEPFLDFLIEVSWPKGSLYREFTVLVDPPATYQQTVIPVATVARSSAHSGNSFTVTSGNSPAAEWQNSDGYLTKRNDTLWEVSEQLINHDRDISVEQMMIALHEQNPQAFYKDNVNALMAGKKLRVPDKDTILRLSKQQAAAEFRQQNKAWRGRVTDNVANATSTESNVALNEQGNQLKLVAPTEAEISDQLLVSPDAENTTTPGEEAQLEKANSSVISQESLEIQARLEKLEQQLVMMQQMLAVKDEQLAALQDTQIESAAEQATPATVSVEKPAAQTIKPAATAKLTKPVVKPKPKAKPVVRPQPEQGIDGYYLMVGTFGVTLLGLLGWVWWRQRKLEEEYSAESMFASSSEIVLPETDQDLSLPLIDESTSYDVGTVGESSFLSEFVPGDLDSFETEQGEVDPISEADVYLAYGRYQQAEELIRQAIQDQPDRAECKLKLLEIFYANENKQAFEDYATELADAGSNSDADFWSKVIEMGSEINPDSTLYTLAEAAENQQATVAVDEVADFSADVAETTVQPEQTEQLLVAAETEDATATDFDLSAFDVSTEALKADEEVSQGETLAEANATGDDAEAEQGIDFDLSAFSTEQQDTDQDAVADSITTADQDDFAFDLDIAADAEVSEAVDFDFTADTAEDTEQSSVDELSTDDSLESFDFSTEQSLELDLEEDSSVAELDFNFDIPEGTHASTVDADQEENEVSDITDMDEFETKIDLAKAYIDMGDEEAAKNIAEEVLQKGSDGQKEEAQSVLAQLH